ncbi:NCS2 family permease [Fundicoccus ignavus]|uniref:NCS2 family permease n=1 Tax=Fundicoccus ignavus TaxID=2664442 RepID=UPI0031B64AFC
MDTLDYIQDILAAIGVVINGIPQGILALSFGFAAFPTGLGFAFSAIANAVTGSVAPVSFQVETITVAGTMGDNKRERVSLIFYAAIIMTIIGLFGLMDKLVGFVGVEITSGMMAGVGLILAKAAIDMARSNRDVGIISFFTALIVYILTHDLVYTIVASVGLATFYSSFYKKQTFDLVGDVAENKLSFVKPLGLNWKILRGALALACLNIGSNISFGMITGSMTGSDTNPVDVDVLTVVSSVADFITSLFGGAPLESIISATGSAPNPVFSGVLMMTLMALLLFFGVLPKLGKFVPMESIAGFLFVLGAIVTVPSNFSSGSDIDPMTTGITMIVSYFFDPFFGMLAGVVVKFLLPLLGVSL